MSKENKDTLPLPMEKMPSCWNKEDRMSALFSPFRSKSANPQDWISKYKFWQSLIYEWLKHTMHCTFSITDLNNTFKRKGCTPLCLTTVAEELLRNNEIIPESDFFREPCESWTAWSVDILVKRPLSWSFYKMKSYVINSETDKETRYIHLQIVKDLGDIVISILEEKESTLVPFTELLKDCKDNANESISENSIMIALIWLKRTKKIVFKQASTESEILIKLAAHASDNISDLEESLYKLKRKESELIREIELMEEQKLNILQQVKSYLRKELKQVAKTHLKKKIELERTIEKRAQTLDSLRILISSIQDTHSNTAVFSALKTGSDALKKLNESGLSEFNVRDVMDDLSEALEEQKEVQSALSETLKSNDSDIDLEEELAELNRLDTEISPPKTNVKEGHTLEELERRLMNLSVEDSFVNAQFLSKKSIQTASKGDKVANLECA